jgi:Arylsulfotransferase (ASST)
LAPRAALIGLGALLALAGCGATSSDPQAQAPVRHFVSRPDLKPPTVQILRRRPRTTPGYIFIAPKKDVVQAGPLILDNHGRVVWFHPLDTNAVTDFRVQRYRGRPVLTWWRGRPNEGDGDPRYVIFDAKYRFVANVYPAHDLGGDIHEFMITPRNTALFTISHLVQFQGRKVLEGGVQELDIRTGRVLFEWRSLDHVRLAESYRIPPGDRSRTFDYFHINSIEIDDDGNLLISARNTHAVYKLNRRTGRILWRLGGKRSDFTLGGGVRFAWQHDARRQPDGTLTLFDNEAGPHVRTQSRGIVLKLDVKRMRATLVRAFVHRPPIVAVDQGNMQRLPNGHFLIGWGHEPRFTEFGPHGRILFDGRFGRGRVDSYRAYRFTWSGRPLRSPDVAVKGKVAYASWNGATEVKRWRLLAGPQRRDLRPVRTVRNKAFETAIRLSGDAAWIAVQALDRHGRPLRRSAAVRSG